MLESDRDRRGPVQALVGTDDGAGLDRAAVSVQLPQGHAGSSGSGDGRSAGATLPIPEFSLNVFYHGRRRGRMVDMSLNIKNETTHELVRRLAALTGQSQTSAVEDAVRRRLAELEEQRSGEEEERRRRIRAVIRRAQQIPSPGRTTEEIMDELYDETGMPR
ncbi:hypothetical protein F6W69_17695 [Microbacterium oxydans]|nr:hypothetical protein F6W69_17695 [Microbacterium oxydans]